MASGRRLTILYGSQTGTAQDVAERLFRESKCLHFRGPVQSMDLFDVRQLIDEPLVVFVCSTQGQGDEPDNMRTFWRFLLRKNLPADSLGAMRFAVLGIGDSSYDKFNFVAKRLNKRLQQLGAVSLLPMGLADAQHDLGYNSVAAPWIDQLWQRLEQICPMPAGLSKLPVTPRPFRWTVRIVDGNAESNCAPGDIYADCTDPVFDRPFCVTVQSNVRTTSEEHFQDVRLIRLDAGGQRWNPGDVLLVRPQNAAERVTELFELFAEHSLPFGPDALVRIDAIDEEMPVPEHLQRPNTLRTYAEQLWNLSARPRQRAFELLAMHSDNELEREKLVELATAEGEQDFFDYVTRPRRTIVEVLADFPHSTRCLRLQSLFELFEPIKARSFSIGSCCDSGSLDLLVAVVEYRTKRLMSMRLGLCSNWLKARRTGDTMRVVVKAGTMRLPADRSVPLVMVGPGTGLAPFRSILQDRALGARDSGDGGPRCALFFGCRGERADFHCEAELKRMQSDGLVHLFTAFSRDQDDKIYVQHRIREQRELLQRLLLQQNGHFLVSGSSKNMPQAVREALAEALDGADAVEYLRKSGRYQEETWA